MKIYTDGSAHPNPGPGGFGVVVVSDEDKLLFCHSKQSDVRTTNNEQELLAILFAAARYGRHTPVPRVYSDSAYAVNTLKEWMFNWQKNGWKKSNNETPENLDIIKFYYELTQQGFKIELEKIKGHNGNKWNELADKLATGEKTVQEVIDENT